MIYSCHQGFGSSFPMDDRSKDQLNTPPSRFRERAVRAWRGIKRVLPFAGGVLAAFAAMLLYRVVFPPPQPMTSDQLHQVISQTMASATPPPAFSSLVYA